MKDHFYTKDNHTVIWITPFDDGFEVYTIDYKAVKDAIKNDNDNNADKAKLYFDFFKEHCLKEVFNKSSFAYPFIRKFYNGPKSFSGINEESLCIIINFVYFQVNEFTRNKFVLEGNQICWMYFNPYAGSRGQFVIHAIKKGDILKAQNLIDNEYPATNTAGLTKLEAFYELLVPSEQAKLVDIDNQDFMPTLEYYSSSDAFAFECSEETKNALIKWAKL